LRDHAPSSCRWCEIIPDGAPRRHWKHQAKAGAWHLITDGPDLMARLPRQAHFVTVLTYHLAGDRPTDYTGPLYWEHDSDDPAQALEDLRRCVQVLDVEYACLLEAVHVWHSGGRGYHITIPPMVIGAEAGHPQLPRLYRGMIEALFPAAITPTLDRSVYSGGQGRMWRLPNRWRSDTGRHKVPLAMREVLHRGYAELEALTQHPRKGRYWPEDAELSPCPELVKLYQQTVATIGRTATTPTPAYAGERIREGQRNATLCSLAGSMRRRGMSAEAIAAALHIENQARCEPPLGDEEIAGIAKSVGRYAPAPQRDPTSHWGDYWEQRQRAYNERLRLPLMEVQARG
jgi:hypothetical protein